MSSESHSNGSNGHEANSTPIRPCQRPSLRPSMFLQEQSTGPYIPRMNGDTHQAQADAHAPASAQASSSSTSSSSSASHTPLNDPYTTTSNGRLAESKAESKPTTASQIFRALSKKPITTATNGASSSSQPQASSFSQSTPSSSANQNTTAANAKTVTPKSESKTSLSIVGNHSVSPSPIRQEASASNGPSTSSHDSSKITRRRKNRASQNMDKEHDELINEWFPGAADLFEELAAKFRARMSKRPALDEQRKKVDKLEEELTMIEDDIECHEEDLGKGELQYLRMNEALVKNMAEFAKQNDATRKEALHFVAENSRNHQNQEKALEKSRQGLIRKRADRDEKIEELKEEEEKYEEMKKIITEERDEVDSHKDQMILDLGGTPPAKKSSAPSSSTPSSSSQLQNHQRQSHQIANDIGPNPPIIHGRSQARESPPRTPQSSDLHTVKQTKPRILCKNRPTVQGPKVYVPSTSPSPSPSYTEAGPSSSSQSVKRAPTSQGKEEYEDDEYAAEPLDTPKKRRI